jgi:hypothetical protein
MERTINMYGILVGKPQEKRPLADLGTDEVITTNVK